MLPKIHKQNVLGRPIISDCGSPTDNLSRFGDKFLKPITETIPSYTKDTVHFLRDVLNLNSNLPEGSTLATLYVKSLYTNIPIQEGNKLMHALELWKHFIQKTGISASHWKISHVHYGTQLFHVWKSIILAKTRHSHGHENGALICEYFHVQFGNIILQDFYKTSF